MKFSHVRSVAKTRRARTKKAVTKTAARDSRAARKDCHLRFTGRPQGIATCGSRAARKGFHWRAGGPGHPRHPGHGKNWREALAIRRPMPCGKRLPFAGNSPARSAPLRCPGGLGCPGCPGQAPSREAARASPAPGPPHGRPCAGQCLARSACHLRAIRLREALPCAVLGVPGVLARRLSREAARASPALGPPHCRPRCQKQRARHCCRAPRACQWLAPLAYPSTA